MSGRNDTRVPRRAVRASRLLKLGFLGLTGPGTLLLAAVFDVAPTARPLAHPGITTSVTWTRDVERILERRCMACHNPSGAGPMDLTSYDAARPWARAIREEVLERRMPPTAVRSGAGLFINSRTLSWAESELLVSWADGGAPQGDAAPSPTTNAEARPGHVDVPATVLDSDPSALERTVRVPVTADWVRGWSMDAGAWPATSARVRLQRGGIVGSWAAGDPAVHYPEGTGLQVPTGDVLLIDFTLAQPLAQEEARAIPPTLRIWSAHRPLRTVTHQVLQKDDVVRADDMLLALKLGLADPAARADVVLRRLDGSEQFLLAMGPPGVPDPVMYRLREPLPRVVGDQVLVRTTSPFVLELETAPGPGSKRNTAH